MIRLLLPVCLGACDPDGYSTVLVPSEGEARLEWAEMPVTVRAEMGGMPESKASLLRDVESKGSGALVLVFRTATGQLDSYRYYTQSQLDGQQQTPLTLRVPLTECDFYILGNLGGIRISDGAAVDLMEALGEAFPADEAALEALSYRLDGGALNGAFRRETFAEVAVLGIPYVLISKRVDTAARIRQGGGIPGADACSRLFAKITVTIDHGAFDGSGAHPDYFVNRSLYLRQANGLLRPFSGGACRAESAADILAQSDCDPDMSASNASRTTYSFYVPENMQGTLLPAGTAASGKTRSALVSAGKGAVEPFCTYVEFAGRLDTSAGGYGGDVTYRFYLGADAGSNFDVQRGREYKISLAFRVGSLFDPDWKVQVDNWTDRRLFCLTADAGWTDPLPDGKTVAVRKNRDGAFYCYMNPFGQLASTNALLGKQAYASESYTPSSLSDCAWAGSLLSASGTDGAWLAERGVSPVWDPATGRLSLRVTDATKFDAHQGEERRFSVKLLPEGASAAFSVKLMPDIAVTVADGQSLSEEFYLGQKRTVSVSGFSGSVVCYAADQDPCGPGASGSAHTANRQWKSTSLAAAPFPTVRLDAGGHVVLKTSEYAGQVAPGGRLDVYACYPNRFQSSHGCSSAGGRIIFFSEDYLNDSVEVPLVISEPRLLVPSDFSGTTYLPLDGNEVSVPAPGYGTFDGSAVLAQESFDADLYAALLAFEPSPDPARPWLSCVEYDAAGNRMYLARTQQGGSNLEDLPFSAGYESAGRYYVKANAATGLYSGYVLSRAIRFSKLIVQGFNNTGLTNQWYTDESDLVFTMNYFQSGSTRDPINQLADDESFSVWVKYRFAGADLSRLTVERSGPSNDFTTPAGERIGPVFDIEEETVDAGSGGIMRWTYNESHQVSRSPAGKFVPGGLILPYGRQVLTFRYRNKWDLREFSERSPVLTLKYDTMFCFFVGATRQRYATLAYIPWKNVKYLQRMDETVDRSGRQYMLKLLGETAWYERLRMSSAYPAEDTSVNGHWWYLYNGSFRLDRTDYDVRYVPGYRTASYWSQAAAGALITFLYHSTPTDWSGMSGPLQNLAVFDNATVPSYSSGQPWGTWVVSENGALGSHVAAVYVNTTEAF